MMELLTVEVLPASELQNATGMALDPLTGKVLLCETAAYGVLEIDPSDFGHQKVMIGQQQNQRTNAISAMRVHEPSGIAFCPPSTVYISEPRKRFVKKFDISQYPKCTMEIIAGTSEKLWDLKSLPFDMPGTECPLWYPGCLSVNKNRSMMAICEEGTFRILIMSLQNHKIIASCFLDWGPTRSVLFSCEHPCTLYITTSYGVEAIGTDERDMELHWPRKGLIGQELCQLVCGERDEKGFKDGPRFLARFDCVAAAIMNDDESLMFMADLANRSIRLLDFGSEIVSTLANQGQSPRLGASSIHECLNEPFALCWINHGEDLLISNAGYGGKLNLIGNIRKEFGIPPRHLDHSISNHRIFHSR